MFCETLWVIFETICRLGFFGLYIYILVTPLGLIGAILGNPPCVIQTYLSSILRNPVAWTIDASSHLSVPHNPHRGKGGRVRMGGTMREGLSVVYVKGVTSQIEPDIR